MTDVDPPGGARDQRDSVYRILDANLNRLREALRVIEEFLRFHVGHEDLAGDLKTMRHSLLAIESALGPRQLLDNRDTAHDPFAVGTRPEEFTRDGLGDIVSANLKRAEEAARVIEEYLKITEAASMADSAKDVRFRLYDLEKRLAERMHDGTS